MVKIEYFKDHGYLINTGKRTPDGIEIVDGSLADWKFTEVLKDVRETSSAREEMTGEPVEIVVTLPAIRAALREYSRKFKI